MTGKNNYRNIFLIVFEPLHKKGGPEVNKKLAKPKWRKIITDLGVPLHIYSIPHANSVTCGVLVNVGTRDERLLEEAGLAHATEHMLFQGTKKFLDSADIGAYIENMGGSINAFTDKEETFFYGDVMAEKYDIERLLHILAEIVMYPTFSGEKIVTEMKNIIQEIRGYKDDPQEHLITLARSLVYGEHPLGRNILGTEESVSKFSRQDFVKFHSHYYNANNFDFIVVGRLPNNSEKLVVNLFSKYFAGLSKNVPNNREIDPYANSRLIFHHEKRAINQVHIALIAPTVAGTAPAADILNIFSIMIGGGMSFPLFIEVRDKLGLCYSIMAENIRQSDLGSFMVYVSTEIDRYGEAVKKIFDVINDSKRDAVLLERVKKMMTGQLTISYDNPFSILVGATKNIGISGKPRDRKELLEWINGVTISDVERAVNSYLDRDNFTKVFLTPENLIVSPEEWAPRIDYSGEG